MNEHERRLGIFFSHAVLGRATEQDVINAAGEVDALVAEHKAALSAARDAALEEARVAAKRRLYELGLSASLCIEAAKIIDALKSCPAERYIPEAKVREELNREMYAGHGADLTTDERRWNEAFRAVARALGVDLDATPAKDN